MCRNQLVGNGKVSKYNMKKHMYRAYSQVRHNLQSLVRKYYIGGKKNDKLAT